MFEELQGKARRTFLAAKGTVSKYPVTTIFAAATLGVMAVTFAMTPGGTGIAAKTAAKAGALMLGGLALSSMVTKTEVAFADEIDAMAKAAFGKVLPMARPAPMQAPASSAVSGG